MRAVVLFLFSWTGVQDGLAGEKSLSLKEGMGSCIVWCTITFIESNFQQYHLPASLPISSESSSPSPI